MSDTDRHECVLALADEIEAAPTASEAAGALRARFALMLGAVDATDTLTLHRPSLVRLIRDLTTYPYAYAPGSERDPSEE